MNIQYFGHSAFKIKTEKSELLIDPFLKHNPLFNQELFASLNPDFILVTHGHGDHVGDTLELAKKSDATVIAPFELATFLSGFGVKVHPMHIGGSFNFPFGKVKLTIATHGSAYTNHDNTITYTGNPCGFLIEIDGKLIYHAGDTGLFLDMKLIGDIHDIDYALLPIGDNFTMGIDDAVKAVEFLKPKHVIPMHYNTFDLIKSDPDKFEEKVLTSEVIIINPNCEIDVK